MMRLRGSLFRDAAAAAAGEAAAANRGARRLSPVKPCRAQLLAQNSPKRRSHAQEHAAGGEDRGR